MHSKRDRRRLQVVGVVMCVSVALTSIYWIWQDVRPKSWTPLYGPVAAQQIVKQTRTYVTTSAQKCNNDKLPVVISGKVFAVPVQPNGIGIPVGEGVRVRLPGCTATTYDNTYPPQIIKTTKDLDGGPVTWKFLGKETPIGRCTKNLKDVPSGKKGKIFHATDVNETQYHCWPVGGGQEWIWQTTNFVLPPAEEK